MGSRENGGPSPLKWKRGPAVRHNIIIYWNKDATVKVTKVFPFQNTYLIVIFLGVVLTINIFIHLYVTKTLMLLF